MKKENKNLQGYSYSDLLEGLEKEMEEISQEQTLGILKSLECYSTPVPTESEVDTTINLLRQYMPKTNSEKAISSFIPIGIASRIKLVMSHCSKWYILFSLAVYLFGYFFTVGNNDINPFSTVIVLSPIPLMLGISDIFRSRFEGTEELEMSFRITAKEIALSKLLLSVVLNMNLNAVITLLLVNTYSGINFWRMTVYWCAPFLVISGVALLIASKVRNYYNSLGFLSFWTVTSIFLLGNERIESWLLNLNTGVYLLVITLSLILIIFEIKTVLLKSFERGDSYEAYNM